ncbi:hypothetical protein ACIP8U_20465 [Streptomyces pseudovenezuelae]|uniref:hypothetical protein n=1 Tax=Streptomyces pseudovenezuelae TaxID=67350 RepID=UPI00382BB0AA
MTDATSRPGAEGARGEGRTGRGTGNDPAGTRSPLVTPTGTEAPDLDQESRPAGTTGTEQRTTSTERRGPGVGDEGGFGGESTAGRDKTSGFGRETERGRDTGSADAVGGVGTGTGTGAGGLSGLEGRDGRKVHSGHDGHDGHDGHAGHEARLLPHDECDKLSTRLQHAVAGFVDEPRSAVEEADHVLEEVATRFADAVKQRRRTLRNSWQPGDTGQNKAASAGDTEQLRLALRDYRELTERLLHS